MTSRAKTFRTVSRCKTDSRSPAVHLPFERTCMPFERLVLSVLKNSSSVWTAQATHSKKIISRSNGSSYPFEKFISHSNGSSYPFENSSAVRMAQAIRLRNSSAVWTARAVRARKKQWVFLAAVPKRQDFKTNRHALLNDACRYDYMTQTVVTFLFFVYLHLILNKISFSQLFPRKVYDFSLQVTHKF